MKYDYPTAFSLWGEEEQAAIARVFLSQQFTMGEEVEAFEEAFAAYHNRKHGVMVNSGSSANLVAVAALKASIDPHTAGMYAHVPAVAWATTYAPLVQHGYDLAVVDVDDTWNAPVPARQEGVPDIVVGCSILGNPAYLDTWSDYAKVCGAKFLNDNCESLGATLNGKPTGAYGDIATFSFFHSHQLSAIEGGMILTDDDDLADLCRLLRNHGNAGFNKHNASFDESYDFRLFGYNVRPLELHAAIAREQLKKLNKLVDERRKNYGVFWDIVTTTGVVEYISGPRLNGVVSPFGLHFEVASNDIRTKLASALRSAGIDCRLPTGGSFTKHHYGAPWRQANPTPRANRIHDHGLFLGNAPWDISDKIERAVKVMKEVL